MKYFAIVPFGTEELFIQELKSFKINGLAKGQVVIFDAENIQELLYYALIPKRICKFVSEGKLSSLEVELPKEKKSFGVRLKHPADQDFSKNEIEAKAGALINKVTEMKVDLENPDYWFTIFVDNNDYFLGIDVVNKDLDKRPYRVFNNPQSIKGNLVSAVLRFADYSGKEDILDPFCRAGEIAIEAALLATKTSPWKYEPFANVEAPTERVVVAEGKIYCFDEIMANVNAAKKNAKLAGVDKVIEYSKMDVSWLDTKLEENSVDIIITQPPVVSKMNKKAVKTIEEFFYQAEFVLKPGGKIVIVTMNEEKEFLAAKKYKFGIVRKHLIKSGQQKYNIFEFHRAL